MSVRGKGITDYVVSVDVQDTPAGDGNAVGGKYRYAFSPDIAIITKSPTRLVYQMTAATKKSLSFNALYSNDGRYQLARPELSPDGRSISVLNANTQRLLINIMLQISDSVAQNLVHVDPEVLNEPELPD
ncbi:hypothetical protein [Dokdonella ginsengisoli]|uniref:Uncharacterized protein n=1 Tax=Dokdonella ginsengisoli TaxID=363846 RepID=A0ABV9QQ44_9GAMM